MKKTLILFFAAVGLVVLAGCKSPAPHYLDAFPATTARPITVTNTLSPELLKPPTDLFVLGPGDQLDVEVLGATNSRSSVVVGLDGKVYYSLLDGVDLWGLTLAQAKLRLERELSKYIKPPQVSVSLKVVGSKYVWLLGRLNKPGIYAISGPMTLLEAMAQAGGTAKSTSSVTTQDLADLRHSFVLRGGHPLAVDFVRLLQEGDMSQNIYLKPDDFVFIPSSLSQEVYVLGAVVNPRTVPYSDLMNVVSAIAGANGPISEAYLTHVAIVRGSLSQPQIIQVDYKAIVKGEAPNITLEPGDIVYVPLSPYRFITEYADLIVTTFVRTWTANEGIRAVSGSSGSTGVSVPIGGR